MAPALALFLLAQAAGTQPPASLPQPAPTAKPSMGSGPADTAEIIDALKTCVNGVPPADFLPKVFEADGWLPGGRRPGAAFNGKPTELLPYAKPGGRVINAVQIIDIITTCLTIAQIRNADQVAEIKAAMIKELGAQTFSAFNGDEPFKATMLRTNPKAADAVLLTAKDRFAIEFVDKPDRPMIRIMTTPKRVNN